MKHLMNARSPLVRGLARLGAGALNIARGTLGWAGQGYRTAGGSNFVLNLGIIVIAGSSGLLVWWAVFDPVAPLRSEEVILIEPADRIIDRDQNDEFNVSRRVCMSRAATATVERQYIDGVVYAAPVSAPLQFHAGCHERRRAQDVPSTLPPGRYIYRVRLTFCNQIRCETVALHDIPIIIRGRFPIDPTGPAPPMRDPI
jgi:hypothetical protein